MEKLHGGQKQNSYLLINCYTTLLWPGPLFMHFESKIIKHESHWQSLGHTGITEEKAPSFPVLGLSGIIYCKVSSKDDGSRKMSNVSDPEIHNSEATKRNS